MGQYTITTSDDEDAAITHVSGDPNIDRQTYLEACVHGQLLQPWARQYAVETSPVPLENVAAGYAGADANTQTEVNQLLGLEPTR